MNGEQVGRRKCDEWQTTREGGSESLCDKREWHDKGFTCVDVCDGVKVNSLLMLHDRVLSILGMNSNAMPMNYVKKPPCTNT